MRAARSRQPITDARAVRVPGRAPRWVMPLIRSGLVVSDLVLATLAFVGAFWLREGGPLLSNSGGGLEWGERFAPYGVLLIFVLPIRALTMFYYDLYRLRGEFSLVNDAIRIFKAVAIGSLLTVALAFLYRGGYTFRAFSYARGVFVLDFFLALCGYIALRSGMRAVQIFARHRGVNLIPTLVVGRGHEALLFVREVRERPALGYRLIGVVESGPIEEDTPFEFEGVPVIGGLSDLPEAIRESAATEVVITDPTVSADAMFEVMMSVGRRRGVEFRIAPSLFNCLPQKTEIDQIGALPVITLFREPLSQAARIVKRTSDIIIAAFALAFLSPLWLLVAFLIKLDSKGSIFYKQERVGMDGRVFLFYKFRSMRADADDASHREYLKQFISGNADATLNDNDTPAYKLVGDRRITRVGRVLRRLSLDELPQLLNVLRGDMSLVGPRPPIPYEVEAYELWHRKRLDMKPGLTGLWQVSGRNSLTFDEMVRLDLYYIENWSLLLDLRIILRTLPVMLSGRDAY
jgi:exopolysaccharide biosynthesis polyprenyl glycosylphosphotransferase